MSCSEHSKIQVPAYAKGVATAITAGYNKYMYNNIRQTTFLTFWEKNKRRRETVMGKIEKDECPVCALLRELEEEARLGSSKFCAADVKSVTYLGMEKKTAVFLIIVNVRIHQIRNKLQYGPNDPSWRETQEPMWYSPIFDTFIHDGVTEKRRLDEFSYNIFHNVLKYLEANEAPTVTIKDIVRDFPQYAHVNTEANFNAVFKEPAGINLVDDPDLEFCALTYHLAFKVLGEILARNDTGDTTDYSSQKAFLRRVIRQTNKVE